MANYEFLLVFYENEGNPLWEIALISSSRITCGG